MSATITIRAADTEPLTVTISADGLSDLTAASTATLYARRKGSTTAHVDGAACTIPDTNALDITFDPVGAAVGGGDAFDVAGEYECYVKVTWSDGDITRHPGDTYLGVTVTDTFE